MLTLTGTLVCTILFVRELSQFKPGQTVFQEIVSATTPAMFALPFATNIAITTLIVFRIRKARAMIAGLSAGGVGAGTTDVIYKRVVLGVVESCAIYPLFLLLAIVLYFFKTSALALITGPMTQGASSSKIPCDYGTNFNIPSGRNRSNSDVDSSHPRP